MNSKLRQFFDSLVPFLMLGIAVALVIGLFIMFSYVVLWGLLIGVILWVVYAVKNLLFPSRSSKTPAKTKGRVIEHDDQT